MAKTTFTERKGDICPIKDDICKNPLLALQELVGVMRSIGQNPTEDEILALVLGRYFYLNP